MILQEPGCYECSRILQNGHCYKCERENIEVDTMEKLFELRDEIEFVEWISMGPKEPMVTGYEMGDLCNV